MGDRPSDKHSLDRIDVHGNYAPDNCRWADRKTQMRNRTDNRYFDYNGKKVTLMELSEIVGLDRNRIAHRIDYLGWSFEEAVNTPVTGRQYRRAKL